jgi:hypothetical protein
VESNLPKGWFATNVPSPVTITSQLESTGITTNLDQQNDLTQASNLYFQNINKGKIQFALTLNLTDPDVIEWLQNLSSKLDLSSSGQIGLDTEMVNTLIDTKATLTMYNIYLDNPKILVDGVDDNSNVVSGLIYDKNTHTLTFNAAHFTTFTAVENQTINSSTNNSSPSYNSSAPTCSDAKPSSIPDLFQIDTKGTSAKLFFTPINNTNQFYISYSTNPNAEENGVQVSLAKEGVQNFTINLLKPNTTYYFKIRGQNGCTTGGWSKIMMIKTNSKNKTYYKNNSVINTIKSSSIKKITNIISPIQKQEIIPTPTPTIKSEQPAETNTKQTATPIIQKKCFLWWCW